MQTKRERIGRGQGRACGERTLDAPKRSRKIFGRSDAGSATVLLTTDGDRYLYARSWCDVQDVICNVFSVGAYADYAPAGGQTELESAIPENVSESKDAV